MPEYKELFESFTVVGHNLKFNCGMLKQQYGINIPSVFDTMIAELTIMGGPAPVDSFKTPESRNKRGMALSNLVFHYCNGEVLSKGPQCSFRLGEELSKEQIEYCRKDLEYLPLIMEKQFERIKTLELESVMKTEMRMIPATIWLELSGMNYSPERLGEVTAELEREEKIMRCDLYAASVLHQLDQKII